MMTGLPPVPGRELNPGPLSLEERALLTELMRPAKAYKKGNKRISLLIMFKCCINGGVCSMYGEVESGMGMCGVGYGYDMCRWGRVGSGTVVGGVRMMCGLLEVR